jgi:protocatechuate 3,4-dioxygenase beta subunit
METPEPFEAGRPRQRGTTSRRALLRRGLALSPVLLLGAWRGTKLQAPAGRLRTARAARASQSVPACVVTPQLTEGPYFVDELLYRSDIRADPTDGSVKDGTPLRLGFSISQVGGTSGCVPLAGAVVDVWQCDALGVYSDVSDPGFNTVGKKFLRGSQTTDDNGYAEFLTIYPGWYEGRTVHTHFKVRTHPDSAAGYTFTSQLFYDDALTDLVHAQMPYAAKGQRTLRNDGDDIYRQSGGQLLLPIGLAVDGNGYTATMEIGVDLSAAAPSGPQGGPPRPG